MTQAEENLNEGLNKVEDKFGNIQIAFDFLSVLKLKDHSKWRAKKKEHGGVDNAHPNISSKSNK